MSASTFWAFFFLASTVTLAMRSGWLICEKEGLADELTATQKGLKEYESAAILRLRELRDELELERKNREATNVLCDSLESRVSVMRTVMEMSYDERKRFLEQFGEVD